MTPRNNIQEALDDLWIRYGKTLSSLNDALDQLDKKPKEVIVTKEIEVEKVIEKVVKVEVPVEVEMRQWSLSKKKFQDPSELSKSQDQKE